MKNYSIEMETKDGITRKLETEDNGERTFVFESFYDESGNCLSEELVAWVWGGFNSEKQVITWATEKRLKAVYTL